MSSKGLFQPIRIGNHELKHRVVLAPLTRLRADPETHVPNEKHVQYYGQRAGNGGGLLITEATNISPMAGNYPGAPGIWSKEQIEGWKKVTKAVHDRGSTIFVQLWHVGRATHAVWLPNNAQPVSASAIAINGSDTFGIAHEVPRALEINEISDLINDYAKAAKNAIEAGFDGVEIHGANGYIIDQFINSNSNQRTDRYGGSIENRTRLALEVVDAVVKTVGADKTAIRLSPFTHFQDVDDATPNDTWGYLVQQLQNNHPDLAYLHMIEPRFTFEDSAGASEHNLDHFRNIWKSVFINAGGFGHDLAGAIEHAEKTGDLIAFGRYYIANPDLPYRLQQQLPLNAYNRATFYGAGPEGYTDYPTYEETQIAPVTAATA
ncbi:hypothetical protein INT43_000175 [Umbelopsis isabellina]|uniref:NADH:flavin oxidoreductase/NADH oxidase N-terminal domain-containing protein n=1 Tax=Mortierella isabellina TaxID=91625 RepID=A0A8H7PFP3_MORIS|nr:hypothetical protein INT43_000175 [Umbelopsis isabellina]